MDSVVTISKIKVLSQTAETAGELVVLLQQELDTSESELHRSYIFSRGLFDGDVFRVSDKSLDLIMI